MNEHTVRKLLEGEEVIIPLQGQKLEAYQGLVQVNGLSNDKIISTGEMKPITPTEVTAAQFASGDYQSMLVKITGVQFVSTATGKIVNDASLRIGATGPSNITLEDAAGTNVVVYVSSYAKFFATQTVPSGSGYIIGVGTVAGDPNVKQLMPRNTTDFSFMTGNRFSEAPIFTVGSPNPATVAAAGGEATVSVSSNVSWTAAIKSGTGASITEGTTGSNSGTVKVLFTANTDTTNGRSVTVTVSTTADVATKSYDVVFNQSPAGGANESVETFSGFSSTNNSYTAPAATGTYNSTEVTGLIWSYAGTAHNQNATKFILGRYNGSNANPGSLTTSTIATGVGSISIDWKTPFNDSSTGMSFKVFVNDVEKGVFTLDAAAANQTGTYTIDNVNVSGNAVIKITSNEKGRPGVNKVTWTAHN